MKIQMKSIETGVLLEENHMRLSAFPVSHRGPGCFGFVFEELPHRPFLPERADELGIPPGPVRGDLVRGQSVTLPDGRIVTPEEVLGPPRRGTRLVHVGDCGRVDNLVETCQEADGLVIEATYLESEADLARKFGHLTATQAAELAQQAKVGHLYLTHISRRYRVKEVFEEASAIHPHVTVVRDFDQFKIRRRKQDDEYA
jgi:ribonuclease Z